MNQSIHNPNTPTYFIANTGDTYSFGLVSTGQYMDTGLADIEIFTSEADYIARLVELDLDPHEYLIV